MIDLKADIVTLLCDLINIESVTGHEASLADELYAALQAYGGTLIREGNSLIYRHDRKKDKTIALVGHIDTVPAGESSIHARIKDNSVWGRGACDMKGGLASMLKVLHGLESGALEPVHNVIFVFYEGEEGPVPNGINTLLDKNHLEGIDFAYILEPTEGKYSVGCLGSLAVEKIFKGVSAHSANPKTGTNALDEALYTYGEVAALDKSISAVQNIDGFEFYETINVTSLNTFNAFNVLPPEAAMIVNFRFSPLRSTEEAVELLYSCIGKEGTKMLDEVGSCYIGSDNKSFLLDGTACEIMQAWTDIAQLNKAGIPAINFGPGSIKYAHKPDERITVSELKEFYISLIRHI